ncbi:LacI family DNA-binding transcriptional regulator [Brevundimonas vesicularis]|uniref:LacI family DNA-binding transcriptional regulator n=1 Tax=Brevundimonas vesicularis TaxID=41276 RepID=UPI0022EC479D|nr:LacI family DNA-binding transcriptional regulator [Brevundimonas vesicularis]WBT05034.1 LacI family DNA-binding transcriptional regulator [Brevundimonas vesicularis]
MTDQQNPRRNHTMGDIARLAGVSPMTVSRVVNGDARVREATRERVEAIIRETGYVPDPAARILARAGGGRIGLLYANPSSAYLAELLSGALDGARSVGLLLLIEPSRPGAPDEEREAVQRLAAGGAQGVIVPPPLGESDATLDAIGKSGMKAVVLAAPALRDGLISLRVDDQGAAHEMMRHLLGLGHRAVGFVEGRRDQSATADRRHGAQVAVDAVKGATMWAEAGDFTYRSGFQAGQRLLGRSPRPTAIFASNDDMAAGVLAAVHAAGLSTPGDISVAGFDDTYLAASVWPTLTTIRQPVAEMARSAAVILGRGGEADGPVPHQFIARESTAPPYD